MSDVRDILERVAAVAPPRRDGFAKQLWRRIDLAERKARRRRAAATLIAGALAAAALSAGGVFAFGGGASVKVVDRTLRCQVPNWGGVNVVDVSTRTAGPPTHVAGLPPEPNPAYVSADIRGPGFYYLAAAGTNLYANNGKLMNTGFVFNDALCRPSPPIPLSRAPLSRRAALTGTHGAGFSRACWLGSAVTVRLRVHVRGNVATAAQLALRSGAKLKPTAYIDWTPTRVHVFTSSACGHMP